MYRLAFICELYFQNDLDLDLLSGDLLDLLQPGTTAEDVFDDVSLMQPKTQTPSQPQKRKAHTDHDYFAHHSPGQHSDSGVSLNSVELEDSYLPSMATTAASADNRVDDFKRQKLLDSSPHQSESMSPLSDTSDSNPLGLEDFDFSTYMEYGDLDTAGSLGLDTINSSAFSGSKDTDVSIDFGKIFRLWVRMLPPSTAY